MASRAQVNNVIFLGNVVQVLENSIRVSYAYSIFLRIRTFSNVFYFSVRVCSSFDCFSMRSSFYQLPSIPRFTYPLSPTWPFSSLLRPALSSLHSIQYSNFGSRCFRCSVPAIGIQLLSKILSPQTIDSLETLPNTLLLLPKFHPAALLGHFLPVHKIYLMKFAR